MEIPLRCYIGLGSNIGDRLDSLQKAVYHLAAADGVSELSASTVFESPAWGYTSEYPYLNAVISCNWAGPPLKLQELCYKIETEGGRHRAGANPPRYYKDRTIDLDLIAIDGIESTDERLILPHPRAHLRGFVIVPLAEIAADLQIRDLTAAQWLSRIDSAELASVKPWSGVLQVHQPN